MVTNIFVSYLRENFSKIVRIRFSNVRRGDRRTSKQQVQKRRKRGRRERERMKERKKEALYTLAFG